MTSKISLGSLARIHDDGTNATPKSSLASQESVAGGKKTVVHLRRGLLKEIPKPSLSSRAKREERLHITGAEVSRGFGKVDPAHNVRRQVTAQRENRERSRHDNDGHHAQEVSSGTAVVHGQSAAPLRAPQTKVRSTEPSEPQSLEKMAPLGAGGNALHIADLIKRFRLAPPRKREERLAQPSHVDIVETSVDATTVPEVEDTSIRSNEEASPVQSVDLVPGLDEETASSSGHFEDDSLSSTSRAFDVDESVMRQIRAAIIHKRKLYGHTIHNTHTLFRNMDIDKSGSLSIREIEEAFRRLDLGLSEGQISHLSERMDRNKDGSVSYRELVDAVHGFEEASTETAKTQALPSSILSMSAGSTSSGTTSGDTVAIPSVQFAQFSDVPDASLVEPPPTPAYSPRQAQRNDIKWYYIDTDDSDARCGPFNTKHMLRLIDDRIVFEDSPVWCYGLPTWIETREVPFFESRFPLLAPTTDIPADKVSSYNETDVIGATPPPTGPSPHNVEAGAPEPLVESVACEPCASSVSPRHGSGESNIVENIVRGIQRFLHDPVLTPSISMVRHETVQTDHVDALLAKCSTIDEAVNTEPTMAVGVEPHVLHTATYVDAASQVISRDTGKTIVDVTVPVPYNAETSSRTYVDHDSQWYETHVQDVLAKIAKPSMLVATTRGDILPELVTPPLPEPEVPKSWASDDVLVPRAPQSVKPVVDSLRELQSLMAMVKLEKENLAKKKKETGCIPFVDPASAAVEVVDSAPIQLPSMLRDLIDTVEKEKRRISSLRL